MDPPFLHLPLLLLPSSSSRIRIQFEINFCQNSSIFHSKSSLRFSSHLSYFSMNHVQVNAAFSISKIGATNRREVSRGQREEGFRLSPKTAYFNVIAISQLRPRHHRYQQDVRRRVKLTTAHVNEHR